MSQYGHTTIIRAWRDMMAGNGKISLRILQKDWTPEKMKLYVVTQMTLTELTPNTEGVYMEPSLRLGDDEAQELMDQLWQCGMRPTEGKGSAGQLAATERHLEDMRKLAGKACGVEL